MSDLQAYALMRAFKLFGLFASHAAAHKGNKGSRVEIVSTVKTQRRETMWRLRTPLVEAAKVGSPGECMHRVRRIHRTHPHRSACRNACAPSTLLREGHCELPSVRTFSFPLALYTPIPMHSTGRRCQLMRDRTLTNAMIACLVFTSAVQRCSTANDDRRSHSIANTAQFD